MQLTNRKLNLPRLAAALVGTAVAIALALASERADIVRSAAGVGNTPEGLGGFVKAADALVTPAIVAMAAVAPLACIVGAASLMFGSRKGLVIIGAALGTLVFVASIKGIVA